MSLSSKANTVLERGLAAFRRMRVRPEGGHTQIVQRMSTNAPRFQFGCVVGAIAYEASILQGLSDRKAREETEEDDNAKSWVAKLFDVSLDEVCQIEQGFDAYFEDNCECADCKESGHGQNGPGIAEQRLASMSEMWQVGWHVAKRATKFYQDLDTAETEAWKLYTEQGLKNYRPKRARYFALTAEMTERSYAMPDQAEMDRIIAEFIEDCEGDDCPDPKELVPLT